MQAGQLQRLQQELLAVQKKLHPLQKRQQEELVKDAPNETILDRLERAIAPLAAVEQQLLEERQMLESRPGGEQRLMQCGRQATLC